MVVKSDKEISPQIHIVEASAGSGKTYALAKRYIQLLMNPALKLDEIPIKEILAITFTNKATFEMKERIIEFLKNIAFNEVEDDILEDLSIDRKSAKEKAYNVMDYIIKNYHLFQVQTIDSFINTILSGCAFKINLSAGFKIKTDYSDYLTYSMDKFVDRAKTDKNVLNLFHKFLQQYLFIENRTGWFPKKEILTKINSLFKKSNTYKDEFIRSKIETKELIILKKNILKLMNDLNGNLPEETNKTFLNSFSSFLKKNKDSFDIGDISSYFKEDKFPVKKNYEVSDNVEKLWLDIKKNIIKLVNYESKSLFNYYIDIFNMVLNDFRNLSSKDDVLFLEELNKQTRKLFDERSLTVPELYYRLALRFRHFLIDEFQDTSRLQWENLFIMVEEAISMGGSLFYVGDKKQAIYRFRGGDVSLFDSVKNRFKGFKIIFTSLDKNYRSSREIVEFNNKIFSIDNLERFFAEFKDDDKLEIQDINEIINIFKGPGQKYEHKKEHGYVKVEFIDSENKEKRDEIIKKKLINLIKELEKRYSYRDIALLTRENDDVKLLTSWLLEVNIPVESEKTLNIRENSLIKELISFLKFINSPIDNLSFASFILGDIFSLATGVNKGKIHDFIFEINNKKTETNVYLYKEFQNKFPEIWKTFFEDFFKNVGFVPLYELTISILNKFNCLLNFPSYQGFFMRFLELIKEQESERYIISSFLEFFDNAGDDELYISSSAGYPDSVKVFTIHKSKGLEFSVVILPFLTIDVKVDTEIFYAENGRISIFRTSKKYRTFSTQLEEIYREEYKKSFIDELNSIYVAFTRPKYELYIFIPERISKNKHNPANILIGKQNNEIGKKAEYKKDKNNKKETLLLPISQYKDWMQFLKGELGEKFQNREKVLKGNILHTILSFIGNLLTQDKDSVINETIKKIKTKFPFIDDFKEFENIVRKMLADKRFYQFFFVKTGTVYQEKEIIDSLGNTKRIDRLIVSEQEVCIIDYKSSKDEDINYNQIKEYINIIKDIYPKQKIKGVLIYLDDLSIEEIYG